jgi:hypothetical protein
VAQLPPEKKGGGRKEGGGIIEGIRQYDILNDMQGCAKEEYAYRGGQHIRGPLSISRSGPRNKLLFAWHGGWLAKCRWYSTGRACGQS